MWITHNQRWSSPKYLCGESYGGIRAAGLADHLQERYGMSLNGVIMLSSLLDFRTLIPSQGSQLSYQIYLPTFATTALHHGKIKGERDAVYQAAREFAYGDYTLALLKGNEIKTEEFEKTAAKLAELTGISAEIWKKHQLRIDSSTFRAELLRAEGKVIGRFDARVAWDVTDPASSSAEYDPSYSLAYQAFSTAMLTYLGDELGWKEDQPYEILTNVSPWNYGADNRIVNLTTSLATALRDNPKLKVLVRRRFILPPPVDRNVPHTAPTGEIHLLRCGTHVLHQPGGSQKIEERPGGVFKFSKFKSQISMKTAILRAHRIKSFEI
jgi:carboxypeptidase C (cathepsin A)